MLWNSATRRNSTTVRSEDLQIQKNTPKLREGRFWSLPLFQSSLIICFAEKQFFSVVVIAAFILKLKHFKVTN